MRDKSIRAKLIASHHLIPAPVGIGPIKAVRKPDYRTKAVSNALRILEKAAQRGDARE